MMYYFFSVKKHIRVEHRKDSARSLGEKNFPAQTAGKFYHCGEDGTRTHDLLTASQTL